jgi:PPP family 3-phenylpropionic acid transporter
VSFGAGGALGSLLSGYLWLTPGPMWTFILAALAALIGFLIAWRWLSEDDRHNKAVL